MRSSHACSVYDCVCRPAGHFIIRMFCPLFNRARKLRLIKTGTHNFILQVKIVTLHCRVSHNSRVNCCTCYVTRKYLYSIAIDTFKYNKTFVQYFLKIKLVLKEKELYIGMVRLDAIYNFLSLLFRHYI